MTNKVKVFGTKTQCLFLKLLIQQYVFFKESRILGSIVIPYKNTGAFNKKQFSYTSWHIYFVTGAYRWGKEFKCPQW